MPGAYAPAAGRFEIDAYHYLILMGACLALTAPLEVFGDGVYRQLRRTAAAILPVAAVFVLWDAAAIAAGHWTFDPAQVTGVRLPGRVPLDEVLFFLAVPVCAILGFEAVRRVLDRRASR